MTLKSVNLKCGLFLFYSCSMFALLHEARSQIKSVNKDTSKLRRGNECALCPIVHESYIISLFLSL